MSIFKDYELNKEKAIEEFKVKQKEENIRQIIKRYEKDCEDKKKAIKSFSEIMQEIVDGDTYKEFCEKTGLSKDLYYSLTKGNAKKSPHYKKTIVAVCVAYDVGIQVAMDLLRSQGSIINPHREADSAYVVLLTEYRGKTIEECNELLELMGIKKEDRL